MHGNLFVHLIVQKSFAASFKRNIYQIIWACKVWDRLVIEQRQVILSCRDLRNS